MCELSTFRILTNRHRGTDTHTHYVHIYSMSIAHNVCRFVGTQDALCTQSEMMLLLLFLDIAILCVAQQEFPFHIHHMLHNTFTHSYTIYVYMEIFESIVSNVTSLCI